MGDRRMVAKRRPSSNALHTFPAGFETELEQTNLDGLERPPAKLRDGIAQIVCLIDRFRSLRLSYDRRYCACLIVQPCMRRLTCSIGLLMGRTSTEKILAALSGRKDVEPGDIVMADLDLVVDWKQGSVRNLASGSELAGRPLPDQLLDIAERGGFIPILQSEGLLEAIE